MIHPAMCNLAWIIPGHIDKDSGRSNFKDQVRTMFGHKGPNLAISRKGGYRINPAM